MSLNKKEIKILKHINNNVSLLRKESALRYLIRELNFPYEVANKVAALWFLNYRKDGKYEEIEEVNRDTNPILKYLDKIEEDPYEFDQTDIPEKFFNVIKPCKVSRSHWGNSVKNPPCIEISDEEVTFYLDGVIQDYTSITGIYEDDYWRYSEAFSDYGAGYYEEYEKDEFDYFIFNDETIELIKKIAIITNHNDVLEYIDGNTNYQSEDLANYLEKMLPGDTFDDIVTDYINTIDTMTYHERSRAVRELYNSEIKYPIDKYESSVTIPYDDFRKKIEDNSPLDFDEVADLEFQDTINIEDAWYSVGYWDSESNDHVEELNGNLERWIENNEDGKYDLWLDGKLIIDDIIKKTNLSKRYGDLYTSKDGRLRFNYNSDIDFINQKIKFTYDGESHMVPFENFTDWAQGSVLNLKNESVRYGKVLMNEEKNNITKISIFDFDGTLADTPNKEDGIVLWEAKTKKEYPYKGWWSKPESLDESVFNIKLIPETKRDYIGESVDKNTLMVMLTGRLPKLANIVEKILNEKGIVFDEYHYKEKGDTFTSKINTIKKLIEQHPNVTEIEMWEDRENHADGFEEWGIDNGVNIKVNRVTV